MIKEKENQLNWGTLALAMWCVYPEKKHYLNGKMPLYKIKSVTHTHHNSEN